MGCLGNFLWFIFGGAVSGLSWCLAGCLWCITIVGIPVGTQCFKLAALSFFPFGKEVRYGGGAGSFLLNILWLIFSGPALALEHAALGALLCVTIIGIPIGRQAFKMASLTLAPFGKEIVYGGGAPSVAANVVWLILGGWWSALCYLAEGALYCVTIVGIPFGLQLFKMAKLTLWPFGAEVR